MSKVDNRISSPQKRIGIFAGTFDPVHDGHIAFAKAALDAGMHKVMFLVEPRPRRKQGVRALEHRLAMVQLAVSKQSGMGMIVLEQARFTINETLPVLQARFKGYQLVLLFGDDVIMHIAHWPHIESLVESTELFIASRHADPRDLTANLKTLQQTRSMKLAYEIVHLHQEVASSQIRLKLKRGETVTGVPVAVAGYINTHKLYSSADTA